MTFSSHPLLTSEAYLDIKVSRWPLVQQLSITVEVDGLQIAPSSLDSKAQY